MADEPDGVNEAWERTAGGSTRVALTAAGQLVELAARARQREAGEAGEAALQRAREMTARSDAERSAARALLAATERPEWWDGAEPADVAGAWQAARTWREVDPDAAQAADRIREQVRDRYGVDPAAAGTDPQALREALETVTDAEATTTSDARAKERGEVAEAVALLTAADRADARETQRPKPATEPAAVVSVAELASPALAVRASEAGPHGVVRPSRGDEAGPNGGGRTSRGGEVNLLADARAGEEGAAAVLYDSAERRQDMAAGLEGVADQEAVQARVTADVHQGKPADQAPAGLHGEAPRARTRRSFLNRGSEQNRTLGR